MPNTVAQVYNYLPLENNDFEINPAELGLFHNVSSYFANNSNLGNGDYQARIYRVGITSFIDPLNFGLTFTTNILPNQVSIGVISLGTGYNFQVNSKLNCAIGLNYKLVRGTLSSGFVDYLKQTAVPGYGQISDGFNTSLILSDSLKRIYFSVMVLNAFPIANQDEVFPKYFAIVTGNTLGIFKSKLQSSLYLESYIKYSLLNSKPVFSTIVNYKWPFNPNAKYVFSSGTSFGVIDEKYYQIGLLISFANSKGNELIFRYNLVNEISGMQENYGFYVGFVSNRPLEIKKKK
ncbi:MAG: hypothetical protein K9H61_12765 [Bacteroidia bacterium]|nr:hypothetical protein [Bacteroidia bacterium]MCF8426223.1 hypothetical protein [Bacteroidia bacterium]MCF8447856.1 hypothetical protein [Bacteroidia bacterium]